MHDWEDTIQNLYTQARVLKSIRLQRQACQEADNNSEILDQSKENLEEALRLLQYKGNGYNTPAYEALYSLSHKIKLPVVYKEDLTFHVQYLQLNGSDAPLIFGAGFRHSGMDLYDPRSFTSLERIAILAEPINHVSDARWFLLAEPIPYGTHGKLTEVTVIQLRTWMADNFDIERYKDLFDQAKFIHNEAINYPDLDYRLACELYNIARGKLDEACHLISLYRTH